MVLPLLSELELSQRAFEWGNGPDGIIVAEVSIAYFSIVDVTSMTFDESDRVDVDPAAASWESG